jgi:hypothetical protein
MNLPDIPEYAAGYFNFIIDFAASPKTACKPYKAKNKVNKDLLTYSIIGLFFTWLLFIVLQKIGTAFNDKSGILQLADNVEAETLPLIVLPCIILFSLLAHIAILLVLKVNKKKYPDESVNFKNTVNGMLAFFSFAPFSITFAFLLTMLVAYNFTTPDINPLQLILLVLPAVSLMISFLIYYFPQSLASVQPDLLQKDYGKAIISVYVFIVTTIGLIGWTHDIFN